MTYAVHEQGAATEELEQCDLYVLENKFGVVHKGEAALGCLNYRASKWRMSGFSCRNLVF